MPYRPTPNIRRLFIKIMKTAFGRGLGVSGPPRMGALNLHWIEFARKRGGNCKKKIRVRTSQSASVWICKEWNYSGNQKLEVARNRTGKEMNLQGTELANNGSVICKKWTLQGMRLHRQHPCKVRRPNGPRCVITVPQAAVGLFGCWTCTMHYPPAFYRHVKAFVCWYF